MVSFAITCSWRMGWNVREQPCSATSPRVKPFRQDWPSRLRGPPISWAYGITINGKGMLAPKGFLKAHHSKTLGTGNEADATKTPQNRLNQLAQGLQLGDLTKHNNVGVGPQPAEIHGLRDLAPLTRSSHVTHHGPTRGTSLAEGLANPIHLAFTDKKINSLHFGMEKDKRNAFQWTGMKRCTKVRYRGIPTTTLNGNVNPRAVEI